MFLLGLTQIVNAIITLFGLIVAAFVVLWVAGLVIVAALFGVSSFGIGEIRRSKW